MNVKKKKRRRPEKIAIVIGGGAMRCAYGAGALLALAEHYKFLNPDIVIASSGSVGGAISYLARQFSKITSIWLSQVPYSPTISRLKYPIINADYLAYAIIRERNPIDLKTLGYTLKKTLFLVPLTKVFNGQTVYKKITASNDIYDTIRAAGSVPFLAGKVAIVGSEEYADGDFGTSTEDLARRALREGATKIIVIECNPEKNYALRHLYRPIATLAKRYGKSGLARALLRETQPLRPFIPPKRVAFVYITPTRKNPVELLDKRVVRIREALSLGYDDAVNHPKLEELLKPS